MPKWSHHHHHPYVEITQAQSSESRTLGDEKGFNPGELISVGCQIISVAITGTSASLAENERLCRSARGELSES
jgi:hypothetical protein